MSLESGLNGLLFGTTGYALYLISPKEYPYAWTACAFGITHGILGLMKAIRSDNDKFKKVNEISGCFMELVALPLVNVELYLHTESSKLAMGHGLFIIPLLFDVIARKWLEEGEEENVETLKELTIMGNIMSLVFLAFNEANLLYGCVAMSAFIAKYGKFLADTLSEGTGMYVNMLGNTIFFYLTALTTTAIGWTN